jgi:hypothetical protein
MSQKKTRRAGVAFVAVSGLLFLTAGGALAQGPPVVHETSASCTGQFFSSHAGSATEGVTVGGFVSVTAQELGAGFGQTIAAARELPREDCGL